MDDKIKRGDTMEKITYTVIGMYLELYNDHLHNFKGHFPDEYEGQRRAERIATRWAVQNTPKEWRKQYER